MPFARQAWRVALSCIASFLLVACATTPPHDPLNVSVAGIEPLPAEGMEMRVLVRLRVQNPNDAPIEYDGVALGFDVQGKKFASGVAAEIGVVPAFGEAVLAVPVTVSLARLVKYAMDMLDGQPVDRIRYSLHGKLSGTSAWVTHRFAADGDFELPKLEPSEVEL
jgi:LEA14-like dessication related protein